MSNPLLRQLDAVTVQVPDLDEGLDFYRHQLGHELLWRNDAVGQAGLRLPESSTEIVLSTSHAYAPNWLVTSVGEAVERMVAAGGRVIAQQSPIPVGRVAVVSDPFDNPLVLVDLSTGGYLTDAAARVTGIQGPPTCRSRNVDRRGRLVHGRDRHPADDRQVGRAEPAASSKVLTGTQPSSPLIDRHQSQPLRRSSSMTSRTSPARVGSSVVS